MMCPYPGKLTCTNIHNGKVCRAQLLEAKDTCSNCIKSGFNFWQSNSRITIECCFGMLIRVFGVLRQPLEVPLAFAPEVVTACMILHNHRIDDRLKDCEPNDGSFRSMQQFCK